MALMESGKLDLAGGREAAGRAVPAVVGGVERRAATVLHADLDAFYASVEQLLDPSLRGKPIAVGGGVVLAASYEAKAFGVRGGMPGREARQLCPQLIFVGGHFTEYQRLGDAAIAVLHDFTPAVERISIDEAFADVAGSEHLFGSPEEMAREVRRRVRVELGLPISIGIARTKHLAKVASQVAKPDGLLVVDPARELEFLHELPVELLWGVGPATRARLATIGVTRIGELARTPGYSLERILGQAIGSKLDDLAWNRDPRRIVTDRRARSIGAQSALGRKPPTRRVIVPALLHLADRVASRLRAGGRGGRTVTVRVRFADFRAITRSVTMPVAIAATGMISEVAQDLVRTALADHPDERWITLLAIGVSHLEDQAELQLELPLRSRTDERRSPGSPTGAARWVADRAVDAIRERFGRDAVGYGAAALEAPRTVPGAFRDLAERNL
jgi:DNA polymerase-4